MRSYQIAITYVAFAAELWLLVCLGRFGIYKLYPFFALFILWDVLRTWIGLPVMYFGSLYRLVLQLTTVPFIVLLAATGVEETAKLWNYKLDKAAILVHSLGLVALVSVSCYFISPSHSWPGQVLLQRMYTIRAVTALIITVGIWFSSLNSWKMNSYSVTLLVFCVANVASYLALLSGPRRALVGSVVLSVELLCWVAWTLCVSRPSAQPHNGRISGY